MIESFASRFMVPPGGKFILADCDTRSDGGLPGKEQAKAQTALDAEAISDVQDRLYAEGKRAVLVVVQGMDCAGKDGTVRAVFNTCGPIGVTVTPFKAPSEEERAHDYLWRVHKACPRRGMLGIFNRSHYEDVLVVKVRNYAPAKEIERRYDEINRFEQMLNENGTRVVKFMLHISKEEQAERLQERVDEPSKNWKFNLADLEDRKYWVDYMAAYEIMLNRCSTDYAPWYAIPSDRNWVRNAIVARIVRNVLEEMDPRYPPPNGWDPASVKVA